MKYLSHAALFLAGFGLCYYLFNPEPIIIDETKKYEQQRDSLLSITVDQKNQINLINQNLSKSEHREDSLKDYQNKMYVYFYKQNRNRISNVPDDSVGFVFSGLANRLYTND